MGKHKSRNIGILIAVAIGAIIGTIALYPDSFDDLLLTEAGDNFSIPFPEIAFQELSLTSIPDITCRYRTTLFLVDSAGNTIRSTSSNSQFNNPQFSLVDVASGAQTVGYVVQPKAGCNAPAAMVLHPTSVVADFEALNESGQWVLIQRKTIQTERVEVSAMNAGVKSIGHASIFSTQVENKVGSGFASEVRVTIDGIIPISYKGYESIVYYYDINPNLSTVYSGVQDIVAPEEVEDPDTRDRDNDGFIDRFDDCDTQKETFNGYKDNDGCPDEVPDQPEVDDDTGEETPPTSDQEDGGQTDDAIDSTEDCIAAFGADYTWDATNNVCLISEGSATEGSQASAITGAGGVTNAHILVKALYLDGQEQAFTLPLEGQSDIEIEFTQQFGLIGSFDGQNKKGLREIELEVFVDTTGRRDLKVDASTVQLMPQIRVAGTDIDLDDSLFVGFSSTNAASQSLPKSVSGGTVSFTGLSLGKASIQGSDIELAIGRDLVPEGQRRDVDLHADIAGTIFLVSNTGEKLEGELTDGFLDWKLEIERRSTDLITKKFCEEGQNAVATTGTIQCLDFGAPTPSEEACTLGQAGCEICLDSERTGGFPCDQVYRDTFCSGTTQCNVPSDFDRSNPNEEKVPDGCESQLSIGVGCISTDTDGTSVDAPVNLQGGFPSQVTSNLQDMLIVFGVVGIIAAIVIIIYKRRS